MKRYLRLMVCIFCLVFLNSSFIYAENLKVVSTKTEKCTKYYNTVKSKKGKILYKNNGFLYKKIKAGKYIKVNKNRISTAFGVYGEYYYYSTKNSKLCRIKMNGKNEKKYSVSAETVDYIGGGYIFFYNKGLCRINSNGKDKIKIGDDGNRDYVVNSRGIFISKNIENGINDFSRYDLSGKLVEKYEDGYSMLRADDKTLYALKYGDEVSIIKVDLSTYESTIVYEDKLMNSDSFSFLDLIDGKLFVLLDKSVYVLDENGEMNKFINKLDEEFAEAEIRKFGKNYEVIYPTWYSREINLYNKSGKFIKTIRYVKNKKIWKIVDRKIKNNKIIVKYKKSKILVTRKYKIS